jgi:Na+(H+)/acetate symporter ActP
VMSSVDSLLVAGSTIIYRWFIKQKNISEKKWMLRARLLTAWFGVLCMILSIVAPSLIFIWLFVMYLALIFVPAILAGMFSSKISSNASFYSLLIPSVILIAGYIPIWKNIFILTTVLAIVIVLFYDKIFRNK